MDTIQVTILVSLIGCFVGLAGWLSVRDKKITNDAQWKGVINTKLDLIVGIKEDVEELETDVKHQGERIAVVENSVKVAHNRIADQAGKITVVENAVNKAHSRLDKIEK